MPTYEGMVIEAVLLGVVAAEALPVGVAVGIGVGVGASEGCGPREI